MLSGANVALGVTGSIAAVKVVELAHELRRRGASVRAVMSPGARGIVHPWAVEFATDNPVTTEITGSVEHVELCGYDGWADVLLIAPATANTVGKVASAVDDTPVTTCATTALGSGIPVVVAPAMHEPMYDHPGVLEAIDRVESWGVSFVDPRVEEGKAKVASQDAICLDVARAVDDRPLEGRELVVTSGATVEEIDPVRVLTNRSSGRTGREVARACYVAGAEVTLVHGPVGPHPIGAAVPPADHYATVREVETEAEMREETLSAVEGADALLSAAAVGDYAVEPEAEKIRSGQRDLSLSLSPTPKLIDAVREAHPALPIVGFKAETGGHDDELIAAARETLARVDLAFVVANDADVMGREDSRVLLVTETDATECEGTKWAVGERVAAKLAAELG